MILFHELFDDQRLILLEVSGSVTGVILHMYIILFWNPCS